MKIMKYANIAILTGLTIKQVYKYKTIHEWRGWCGDWQDGLAESVATDKYNTIDEINDWWGIYMEMADNLASLRKKSGRDKMLYKEQKPKRKQRMLMLNR